MYTAAEKFGRTAVVEWEEVHGEEHPDTLISVSWLGSVLWRQGKYKEAEVTHQQALEGREMMMMMIFICVRRAPSIAGGPKTSLRVRKRGKLRNYNTRGCVLVRF